MMTIWVFENGTMVIKSDRAVTPASRSDLPTPMLSRMEAYESPIDGKTISSWAQRDREMRDNDCYDPRDLPAGHVYQKSKGRKKVRADGRD
jgi:hypothetical protein